MRFLFLPLVFTCAACSSAAAPSTPTPDASTPTSDARTPRADATAQASTTDATTNPASDAPPAPLPACSWPADLTPSVPDGDLLKWSVSRAVLLCGSFTGSGTVESGPSDDGLTFRGQADGGPPLPSPCVMACEPTQYALSNAIPQSPGPSFPADATIVQPPLPAGCTGPLPAFDPPPNSLGTGMVTCCPCQ